MCQRGMRGQSRFLRGLSLLVTVVLMLLSAAAVGAAPESRASGGALILPIRSLTPGVTNPAVKQTIIRKTICVSGWTATVRPPASYTNALKRKQMPLYHESGDPKSYEEDHLIPLELGGAPRDPHNLWPEPHS
jgi:hypothetical protein